MQATKFYIFFTKDAAEKLYIHTTETIGYTGQNDAVKRDDSQSK